MIMELETMLKANLAEIDGKLQTLLGAQNAKIEETGKMSASLQNEIKDLATRFNTISAELTSIQQKGVKMEKAEPVLSFGAQFTKSQAFADFRDGKQGRVKFEYQANTITGEGGSPANPTNDIVPLQTLPGIIGGAFRSLDVLSVIPAGSASGNTVHYTRETSYTNDAAETAEGGSKPESDLVFEGVDCPVRTIAHWIKVSKQVLDDAPMLESYINTRLTHGLRNRLEYQIINGNGTSPNISGILDSGNFTAATVVTADNDLDFANRIKYQVVSSDYMPSFYLINPADWGRIERMKVGTGDDRYVGADGAIGYLQNGLIPTLWGLPVIASNNVAAGKLICASREAFMFFERQGVTVEMFEQDSDNVTKNLITIRAEMRGAFAVFRPAAIVAGDLPDA